MRIYLHQKNPIASLLAGCCALLTTGCGTSSPPEFQPNRLVRVDHELTSSQTKQIDEALTDLFGTPDEPKAPEAIGLNLALLQRGAGPAGYEEDEEGEEYLQRGLYRQHCAQCHGVTGDGYGPTAAVMSPYPRDFLLGIFKLKTTRREVMPTKDDLRRVIARGVPGTAMPSFRLLDEEQIDALVEYVKYLSIRGQVERKLVANISNNLSLRLDQETIEQMVDEVNQAWIAADEAVVTPASIPAKSRTLDEVERSAKAGEKIFLSASAKCTECHGKTGRGKNITELDVWSRENFDFRTATAALTESVDTQRARLAGMPNAQRDRADERLKRLSQHVADREEVVARLLKPEYAQPRDLQSGAFRGGSEPIDLFRRIHEGIPGTPMPAHGSPRPGVAGTLTEEEIWQVVDYLKSRG